MSSRVPSGRIPAAGRVVPARAGPRDPPRHPQRPAGGVPPSPRPSRRCVDCAAAHADGSAALTAGPAPPRWPATAAAAPTFGCGVRPTLRFTTRRHAPRAQEPRGWSARCHPRRGTPRRATRSSAMFGIKRVVIAQYQRDPCGGLVQLQ